jgi:Na+-translocating ferredoxin:NAD+ oxidoreductase RNF subunit RnfB
MNKILLSSIVMGLLGLFFALILSYASKKFAIKEDPRLKEVINALPGANCGACGHASCEAFAKAVIEGKADYTGCKVGREKVAKKIKVILNKKDL